MNFQMMRVISSPSISTTGFFTLILAIGPFNPEPGPPGASAAPDAIVRAQRPRNEARQRRPLPSPMVLLSQ